MVAICLHCYTRILQGICCVLAIFNIFCYLSRLWYLTGVICCLQVQRGQHNVKANWIYRGKFKSIFLN